MAERVAAAPVLALVFNAFVWGVSWWPFRLLQSEGLHPLWATAFTYVLALAVLLLASRGAWRGFAAQPQLWLLAAAAGTTNLGFNWGVTIGDVVRVVLLFYLMPAWSILLAWLMLGERPTASAVARLLLALAGVGVVLKEPGTTWPLPRELADWLAIVAGFSFALTNILLRKLHEVPAHSRVLAMFGGGALLAGGAALAGASSGTVPGPVALSLPALLVGLALAAFFLVGNMALQYGASRLPAHVTAIVMLSEVLFATVSSTLLDAGELAPRVLAGGVLIVAAAAWAAWPARARGAQSLA